MDSSLRLIARKKLLEMHFESGVGHIGGNLSALDLMLSVYHDHLSADDTFILSKGHAAGALYVTLWTVGKLEEKELKTFHKDDTRLAGHPAPNAIPEIPFATGSLGHGLSLACGMALAKKLRNEPGRVFCMTSDGEWNEGSTWEALIFAAHNQLSNLTVLVDSNRLQGFGTTHEVANLEPLAEKLRTFGVMIDQIDGHDTDKIRDALSKSHARRPQVIVAHTVKGFGVSFMENKMDWHYLPLNRLQYQVALKEVEERFAVDVPTNVGIAS